MVGGVCDKYSIAIEDMQLAHILLEIRALFSIFFYMASLTKAELRIQLRNLTLTNRNTVSIEGFVRAGVLVPVVFASSTPTLLFTKRTDSVETHKGQISFPGGMADAADVDMTATALRETHEELGINSSSVEVMGLLDDLPTPTGFIITPVVGIIEELPALIPNPEEVAEVLLVPLHHFGEPANGRCEYREFRGMMREVWYYDAGEHVIWGATAMIVRSLLKSLHLI